MAEQKPLEVLVIGYGSSEITFIDRLITGLAQKGVAVTIAASSAGNLPHNRSNTLNWAWVPTKNQHIFGRLAALAWLVITHPIWKRPVWFSDLVGKASGWREKADIYFRYLPYTGEKWDLIYFPWNSAAIDHLGLFDSGMPIVVSCRGSQVNIRPHLNGQEEFSTLLRTTLKRANAVHCVSLAILEEAALCGVDRDKAVVIHPAVDSDIFYPSLQKHANKVLRLVTTGSLIWRKGYEYLLMAFSLLREAGVDAELHILGEGYERSRILFSSQDLGVHASVFLHGKLTPNQVCDQLQRSDIFVFASLSEGLPNALLEAMSSGLPVVTSDCGGVREAVTDGVEGFVVPTRSPELMAKALQKLAKDSQLRQNMGACGRERILNDFSLEDQIEKFILLFSSLKRENEKS